MADSADGTFEQVATGDTFTVTKECANRYLKVVAKAKKGIPGSDSCETKAGRILPKGATALDSVAFTNASKGAKDTGSTIEACAYKAVDYSSEPVTEGVTYTWRWSSVDPSSSAFDAKTDWHVVEGKTDSSFTIPDDYAKRWVSVSATAGDNTVEATTAVAVKAQARTSCSWRISKRSSAIRAMTPSLSTRVAKRSVLLHSRRRLQEQRVPSLHLIN